MPIEDRDASLRLDASWDSAPTDSGPELDAAADAQVDTSCALSLVEMGELGIVLDDPVAPVLVRAGMRLFGVAWPAAVGLEVTLVDELGTPVADASILSPGAVGRDFAATTAADGSVLVVFREAERLRGGSIAVGGWVELAELAAGPGIGSPAIARDGDGLLLAWTDTADGSERISTRSLDDRGGPLDPVVRHETPAAARFPALADDESGEARPIAWSDARSGTAAVWTGTFSRDDRIEGAEVSAIALAGGVAVVRTPFGVFLSWVEPGLDGGMGSLHVSRIEDGLVRDRVVARAAALDERTTIAWDGDRLFIGWHHGSADLAVAGVIAVRPDLEVTAALALGEGSAGPSVAADESLGAVAWVDSVTRSIHFGILSCDGPRP
jgi:hypothetical protein